MVTLERFKEVHGIDKLGMYKSTKSDRYVSSVWIGDHEKTVVTTETFNPKEEIFVYSIVPTGSKELIYVLSNKKRRDVDIEL